MEQITEVNYCFRFVSYHRMFLQ